MSRRPRGVTSGQSHCLIYFIFIYLFIYLLLLLSRIIAKRRKLQWYGHVFRSSGLAKTILQGTVKGGGRQGRQRRGGKTTSRHGQAWSSPSPRGQWRTGKNGGNWLRNHLWCPNDPRSEGIDEMRHEIPSQPRFNVIGRRWKTLDATLQRSGKLVDSTVCTSKTSV